MKKKKRGLSIFLKIIMCLVYLVIIGALLTCAYTLYNQKQIMVPWHKIKTTDDYTYMSIIKMSEKFASYEEQNIGFHYVVEKDKEDTWNTYVIAINEKDYNKYKAMIDYTYERVEREPDPIKLYGYPVKIDEDIKNSILKSIANFIPADSEIKITEENWEENLTSYYLNTTKEKKVIFSIPLFISLLSAAIMIILLFLTIIDKGKNNEKEEKENA